MPRPHLVELFFVPQVVRKGDEVHRFSTVGQILHGTEDLLMGVAVKVGIGKDFLRCIQGLVVQ